MKKIQIDLLKIQINYNILYIFNTKYGFCYYIDTILIYPEYYNISNNYI